MSCRSEVEQRTPAVTACVGLCSVLPTEASPSPIEKYGGTERTEYGITPVRV